MSKARVVRHQHRVLAEAMECGQRLASVGWPARFGELDAVDAHRIARIGALGIDQLLEHLLLEEPPVHDAHRADADDLVPGGGLDARGLGVEDRVAQLGEPLPARPCAGVRLRKRSKS
jgi:hypothetical protein